MKDRLDFGHAVSEVVFPNGSEAVLVAKYADLARRGWEASPCFMRFLELVAASRCVFDVGAHAGLYALPAALAMRGRGMVYAFEPSPRARTVLDRHLALNACENCTVVPMFVGEGSGECDFFEYQEEHLDRNSFVAPRAFGDDASRAAWRHNAVRLRVPTVSLDEFCSASGAEPDLLKVDVEGAELKVLRGASRLLERHRPRIFLSLHPGLLRCAGENVEELRAALSAHRYELLTAEGDPAVTLEFGEYLAMPASI